MKNRQLHYHMKWKQGRNDESSKFFVGHSTETTFNCQVNLTGITSLWPAHPHHLVRLFLFSLSFPHLLCPDSPNEQRALLSLWKERGLIPLCPNSWEWAVKPAFPSAPLLQILQDRGKAPYSNAEAFTTRRPTPKFVSTLGSRRRTETQLHGMRCLSRAHDCVVSNFSWFTSLALSPAQNS